MKLLMVIAEMGSGGAESVVAELARDLVRSGSEVTVATSGGWRQATLESDGATLLPLGLRGRSPLRLLRSALSLRRELRRNDTDLIHAHNVKAALVVRLATVGLARRPAILVTVHGLPDNAYPAAARVLRRCADHAVAVSSGVGRRMVASGYPARRVSVIENAITPLAHHDRAEARSRLSLPADAPVVVCIARLAAQKRHDLLIAAWASLPPDALLLIVGDGRSRGAVEHAIDESGQAGRITLLGERRDVDWLLAAADACVLPTDWEGLPISLLEAMAARVPVVASAVPELVSTLTGAAHLVRTDSAHALADGLTRVLTDSDHAAELVEAGANLVNTRFSPRHMLAGYRQTYENALVTEGVDR